jgi:hypothetical protein
MTESSILDAVRDPEQGQSQRGVTLAEDLRASTTLA